MLGRKLIIGLIVAATMTSGVVAVSAQQGGLLDGVRNDSAISAALDAAAAETGLTNSEIMAQLVGGTTLADIVTAEGGDVQIVIDAAVNAMTERVNEAVADGLLTQTRADRLLANLEESVAEAVNGDWTPGLMGNLGSFGGRFGRNGQGAMNDNGGWGRGGRFDGSVLNFLSERGPFVNGLLEDLGIARDALSESLRSGSTLAEAITAAGGDPETALTTVLAAVDERLAAAVENGRLTQTEADTLKVELELRLSEMMNASPLENRLALALIPNALDLASEQTGLTRAELRQEIAGGKSLGDVLIEHELDVTAFVDALMERAAARLNVHVTDGTMTQEQADALLTDLRSKVEERIATSGGDSVLTSSSV